MNEHGQKDARKYFEKSLHDTRTFTTSVKEYVVSKNGATAGSFKLWRATPHVIARIPHTGPNGVSTKNGRRMLVAYRSLPGRGK